MGLLVDGVWHDKWYDTSKSGGRFVRSQSQFRNWITADGSAGPSGEAGFKAENGRYHLYASFACPWVHRTLIYRSIKKLDSFIDVSYVDWFMGENGWTFKDRGDQLTGDQLFGHDYAHQLYTKADPTYSGRVTVPILWDKQNNTIVSNESSEIIRMFNSAFDEIGAAPGDYYPVEKRAEIDALNDRIYETVNNGVYRCGFATSQDAYEEAVFPLFDTLNYLEGILEKSRFLVGDTPTEADWRLFPTLARFDLVYVGHFKCSIKRLIDYPNLWAYARDLYQWPGIRETIKSEHSLFHYYKSHETINPSRIAPAPPAIDWNEAPGRENL